MNKVMHILGIILIVLSVLLLIAVPPAGVIGIIFGVLLIIKSKKELVAKISTSTENAKEKASQRYEILKQKPEEVKQFDKIKQTEVKKGCIVMKDESIGLVNISTQIGPVIYSENEVIPVEEYIKTAIISSNGLYPHEILLLNYAHKYYTTNNDYQGFWWYRYGMKDIDAILSSLRKRGFLEIGDMKSTLEHKTVENLKNILRKHNL
jgi:hypothetical protein